MIDIKPNLLNQIKGDLQAALRSKDESSVSALRFLLSDIHNEEILKQRELTDEELVLILRKQVKNLSESIEAFKKGGRLDLVEKEEREKRILEAFFPAQLSEEEIRRIVGEVLTLGMRDFGQAMGQVMGRLKGQADGAAVARIVKEELEKE